MTTFLYLQSIVNYRIPIDDTGKLGNPEIISKFTKETYAPKAKPKTKPKKEPKKEVQVEATTTETRYI